jgi:hypothetical protein
VTSVRDAVYPRPGPDEAVEYYHGYIGQVPEGDILAILERSGREILAQLRATGEEHSTFRYAPGKWSMREVVSHINDAERLFTFRAFWFARGFDTPLPSFDQNVAVAEANADNVPWERHVAEFESVRAATLSLFGNLPAEAWTQRGIASDSPFSVRALAYIAAGHGIHHAGVLRERYAR